MDLPHDEALRIVQRIFELVTVEGLLMKFHATPPFRPDGVQPGSNGGRVPRPACEAEQQCLPPSHRGQDAPGPHEEAAAGSQAQPASEQPAGCHQSLPEIQPDGGQEENQADEPKEPKAAE